MMINWIVMPGDGADVFYLRYAFTNNPVGAALSVECSPTAAHVPIHVWLILKCFSLQFVPFASCRAHRTCFHCVIKFSLYYIVKGNHWEIAVLTTLHPNFHVAVIVFLSSSLLLLRHFNQVDRGFCELLAFSVSSLFRLLFSVYSQMLTWF